MESATLSHSMEAMTLVFFAYNNRILAGIFKRIYLDSLNPNNEQEQLIPSYQT